MKIKVYDDKLSASRAAAEHAANSLRKAIQERGRARIIAATGASMFDFLQALTEMPGIDWTAVTMFHLDEYVGLPITHNASFRKYLLDRLIARTGIVDFYLLDGEGDVQAVIQRVGEELNKAPVDVAFVGIGENGHIAFNDPPADFKTEEPFLVVSLDDACRRQQMGEGWFASVKDVPRQAITMSVNQIMKSREIICLVPEARKAPAVKKCLEGKVAPSAPASILRKHPNTTVYLDKASSGKLENTILD